MKFSIISIFIFIGCFLANYMANGEVCQATWNRCTNKEGKDECIWYEPRQYYFCYTGEPWYYCDECLDSVATAAEQPEVSESTTTEGKAPETSTVTTHYDVTEKTDVTDYEEATETTESYEEA